MKINIPDALAEVTVQSQRYEKALVSNEVAVLAELFHKDIVATHVSIIDEPRATT